MCKQRSVAISTPTCVLSLFQSKKKYARTDAHLESPFPGPARVRKPSSKISNVTDGRRIEEDCSVFFAPWLPFPISSLRDSNASSIRASVCASFGERRSARPSIAHGSPSRPCEVRPEIIQRNLAEAWSQLLWSSLRPGPRVSFIPGRAGLFSAPVTRATGR